MTLSAPQLCPGRSTSKPSAAPSSPGNRPACPLLLEQLRSPDKALFGIGLRTARELPGRDVTEALAAELSKCSPERQSYLLLALADRNDAAVLPAVLAAAGNGPQTLRLTAVGVLDRLGDVSSVPVLLAAAADADADMAQAALSALARLPGNEVDADLLGPSSRRLAARIARSSSPSPASATLTAPFPSSCAAPRIPTPACAPPPCKPSASSATTRRLPISPGFSRPPKAPRSAATSRWLSSPSAPRRRALRAARPAARAERRHRPAHHRAPRAGLRRRARCPRRR